MRDALARHGLRAHKARGQNFLVDDEVAERIVGWAELPEAASVVEVGPGLGILTRALARHSTRVVAIEIDRGLVEMLRAEGNLPAHVELLHRDALRVNLHALAATLPPPLFVVANLPYSISAPLLRWLLGARDVLEHWVVMLQREVAERLIAPVGSRSYSSLSALYQATAETRRMGAVPSAAFDPVPQVESVVVRTTPRRPSPLAAGELEALEALVRACFQTRRKTLANALRGAWPWGEVPTRESLVTHLVGLGIDAGARAETLEPAEFVALLRSLRGTRSSSQSS